MPGIVGFITARSSSGSEPQLLRMLKAISHETFYSTGTWVDQSMGVYVGWTALSAFSSGMPLRNEKEDIS